MAIYAVQIKILDEQGRSTNREILFDETDEAALLSTLTTYIPAYQAMTKSGVQSYTYRRSVDVSNAPAAGSNVDAGFTVLWDTALTINPTTKVPDPIEALKDGQGGIDILDAIFTAWFAFYNPGSGRVNINNPSQPSGVIRATLDK